MRYCEVFLIVPDPATGGLRGNVFNTSQLNGSNPRDSCPADLWAKVNPESLKAAYGVVAAFKNGQRVWVNDWLELPAGEPGTIGDLEARWFMHVQLPKEFSKAGVIYYKPSVETWKYCAADILASREVEAVLRSRYNAGSCCRSRTETVPVCPAHGRRRWIHCCAGR